MSVSFTKDELRALADAVEAAEKLSEALGKVPQSRLNININELTKAHLLEAELVDQFIRETT